MTNTIDFHPFEEMPMIEPEKIECGYNRQAEFYSISFVGGDAKLTFKLEPSDIDALIAQLQRTQQIAGM